MKIKTTRDALLNKILFVSRAITPKITTYVLSGIMLEADNNLNIYSTDLETSIKTFVKAKVLEKGKVIVPSKILVNVLKSFPEAKIELDRKVLSEIAIKNPKIFEKIIEKVKK